MTDFSNSDYGFGENVLCNTVVSIFHKAHVN
uniref:Uncharacterized protein n=1 Tax=Anguilla anguilla TaxID=7936 RepID=A0A0E9WGR6_ANGAN